NFRRRFGASRGDECRHVRHRSAADKKTGCIRIEADDLFDPINREPFYLDCGGGRTPRREIRIQCGGEEIGNGGNGSAGRLNVTEHSWMTIVSAELEQRFADYFEQLLKISRFFGQ